MSLVIHTLGGSCPIQADGMFDDSPFYFRARGSNWTVELSVSAVDDVMIERRYFGEWPTAGWMSADEALGFIALAYARWVARGRPLTPIVVIEDYT